ncbi:MAG: hypothetical protein AAFN93_22685, partial [Bacteroidota bacterium]
ADGAGTWEGMITSSQVKGLPTVSQVKVLDTDDWVTTATYYDERGREWETYVKNEYQQSEEWVLNKLSFSGKVLESRTMFERSKEASLVSEPVTWANLTNVTSNGNSLTKSSPNGWTSGASANFLSPYENGWVEMTASETDKVRVFGISATDVNNEYETIGYGIYLRSNGMIRIFESGVKIGDFGFYKTGDKFKLDRVGATIYYKKNDQILYTSTISSFDELVVDVSLFNQGATIEDVKIGKGTPGSSDDHTIIKSYDYDHRQRLVNTWHFLEGNFEWNNLTNVTTDGNNIAKQGADGWNAGGSSAKTLNSGENGWAEVTANEIDTYKSFGLSTVDNGTNHMSINYAFYFRTGGRLRINESGVEIGDFGVYRTGDKLRIERAGNTIYYKRNGETIYTSANSSNTDLVLDISLHTSGSTFKNVQFETGVANKVLIASNTYNEIGELEEKNLHSENGGGTFFQSLDYGYNIRGWLTSINDAELSFDSSHDDRVDYFGMEIGYDTYSNGLSPTGLYDGNIGQIIWSSDLSGNREAFNYTYDPLERLVNAQYEAQINGVDGRNRNKFEVSVSYDLQGNILNLTRSNGKPSLLDDLEYEYEGNQLVSLQDNGNRNLGYIQKAGSQNMLSYDANGNLISDDNREIIKIEYNFMNLAQNIEVKGGASIKYV